MNQNQTPEGATPAGNQAFTLKMIWVALVASLFIYGALLFVLINDFSGEGAILAEMEPLEPSVASIVTLAMATLSFLNIWLAYAIQNRMLSGSYIRRTLENGGVHISGISQEEAGRIIMPKYFITMIILWAIVESVALCGFVVGLLTHDFSVSAPFILAAFVAMFFYRPTAKSFDDVVKNTRRRL